MHRQVASAFRSWHELTHRKVEGTAAALEIFTSIATSRPLADLSYLPYTHLCMTGFDILVRAVHDQWHISQAIALYAWEMTAQKVLGVDASLLAFVLEPSLSPTEYDCHDVLLCGRHACGRPPQYTRKWMNAFQLMDDCLHAQPCQQDNLQDLPSMARTQR
eukprot:1158994-Pelagomonas_calceolata.AAC.6